MLLCLLAAGRLLRRRAGASVPDSGPRAGREAARRASSPGSHASDWVREITDAAGPRLPGTPGDRAGVDAGRRAAEGPGLRRRPRGEGDGPGLGARRRDRRGHRALSSRARADGARRQRRARRAAGVEAEIVRVASLEELDARGEAVRGRIVFIDRPMSRTSDGSGYGDAGAGALRGAVARRPPGRGRASSSAPSERTTTVSRTPAPCATRRTRRRSRRPRCRSRTRSCSRGSCAAADRCASDSRSAATRIPDAESANVVGEIVGREKPDEIVLLGAHLDSWDLGDGRARRRRRVRHRDRGGAADRGAAASVRAGRSASCSSPTRRTASRAARRTPTDHAAELDRHVAAIESDLGQGPPLGFSWDAGPGAEAPLKAIAALLAPIGADHLARRRGRRRGPVVPPSVGHPEPRHAAGRDAVLRLPPHRQRHASTRSTRGSSTARRPRSRRPRGCSPSLPSRSSASPPRSASCRPGCDDAALGPRVRCGARRGRARSARVRSRRSSSTARRRTGSRASHSPASRASTRTSRSTCSKGRPT